MGAGAGAEFRGKGDMLGGESAAWHCGVHCTRAAVLGCTGHFLLWALW